MLTADIITGNPIGARHRLRSPLLEGAIHLTLHVLLINALRTTSRGNTLIITDMHVLDPNTMSQATQCERREAVPCAIC